MDRLTTEIDTYFRKRPGVWLTQFELAKVGGLGGWRTRVNTAERKLGLTLEKRQRTVQTPDGRRLRISERRFVQKDQPC